MRQELIEERDRYARLWRAAENEIVLLHAERAQITLEDVEALVIRWADKRELINCDLASVMKQTLKLGSEFGELQDTLAKHGLSDRDEIEDAIGDMLVVMIILSEQLGTSIGHCLKEAYGVIESRTGTTVDGVFIKDNHHDNSNTQKEGV